MCVATVPSSIIIAAYEHIHHKPLAASLVAASPKVKGQKVRWRAGKADSFTEEHVAAQSVPRVAQLLPLRKHVRGEDDIVEHMVDCRR